MTKNLKWRLGKLPTPDEVLKLLNEKLITKEEARDILFSEEKADEKSKESMGEEIKFLKEVVEKLSNNQTSRIVEVIRDVQPIYYQRSWYGPYSGWCSGVVTLCGTGGTTVNGSTNLNTAVSSFSNIS